jgi:hypothetical protein
MVTKELRFPADEKGIKNIADSLVGQVITYWEGDVTPMQGKVTSAIVLRDRYGTPFVEVEMDPVDGPASA